MMETGTSRQPNQRQRKPGRLSHALVALLIALLIAATGCHSLKQLGPAADKPASPASADKEPALALPGKNSLRIAQFVFLADFKLRDDQPVFRELAELHETVAKELQLPSSNRVVQVYLFDDKERYKRFIHAKYPELPERRAFFVAQPRGMGVEDLLVYTYWGDQVRQDLRHELTHAMLHSVLKDVPIWLDEGLAEYFELSAQRKGVNLAHVAKLRGGPDGPARLGLARLEQLAKVEDMHPAEYQESWAWVHLMLHSTPEARGVLLQYLQRLRTTDKPGPLQPNLAAVLPEPEDALAEHLALLEKGIARTGARADP
jgi:hypothetical protein